MVRTSVGYAGGIKKDPTYHNLGDHSEAVQIEYDPRVLSYEDLLKVFWVSHSPEYPPYSGQYKSIIFYHNDKQKKLAEETLQAEQARLGQKVYTEIVPYTEYYLAEDYHQKFYLRYKQEIAGEYKLIYPDMSDFIASTSIARVNGYLGGNGTVDDVESNFDALGLSGTARDILRMLVSSSSGYCGN